MDMFLFGAQEALRKEMNIPTAYDAHGLSPTQQQEVQSQQKAWQQQFLERKLQPLKEQWDQLQQRQAEELASHPGEAVGRGSIQACISSQ